MLPHRERELVVRRFEEGNVAFAHRRHRYLARSSLRAKHLPKRFPLDRARPLMGATASIAAPIGLAGAIAVFLIVGNDASVGMDLVANPVVAEASPVQTLAATPFSPDIHASAGGDAAEPASVNTPAGTARLARAPKSAGSPAATNEAAQRVGVVHGARQGVARRRVEAAQRAGVVHGARQVVTRRTVEAAFHAEHAARQANKAARRAERTVEAALHAQHAAFEANEAAYLADLAARRAERAARRAEQAASQAERAARLANWGFRLQFPWNAITEPRSAS
jgi:hypothetical protein